MKSLSPSISCSVFSSSVRFLREYYNITALTFFYADEYYVFTDIILSAIAKFAAWQNQDVTSTDFMGKSLVVYYVCKAECFWAFLFCICYK